MSGLINVKMIKATTNEGRKVALKAHFIKCYQRNGPEKLGSDAYDANASFYLGAMGEHSSRR